MQDCLPSPLQILEDQIDVKRRETEDVQIEPKRKEQIRVKQPQKELGLEDDQPDYQHEELGSEDEQPD